MRRCQRLRYAVLMCRYAECRVYGWEDAAARLMSAVLCLLMRSMPRYASAPIRHIFAAAMLLAVSCHTDADAMIRR